MLKYSPNTIILIILMFLGFIYKYAIFMQFFYQNSLTFEEKMI